MTEKIQKLRSLIEEKLRTDTKTENIYIDFHDNKNSVITKQNTVIFGRRGSGKSTLLKIILKDDRKGVYINLENYKKVTFPNIIVKTLEELLLFIQSELKNCKTFHFAKKHSLKKEIKEILKELKQMYDEDDSYDSEIQTNHSEERSLSGNAKSSKVLLSGEVGTTAKSIDSVEVKRDKKYEKLSAIQRKLIDYKKSISKIIDFIYVNEPLYVLLDDFYFIKYQYQPYLADIFHVFSKETNIFVKIASVRNRSNLYIKDDDSYIGFELGHDAIPIDLDYSLENMDEVVFFFKQIFKELCKDVGLDIETNHIFTENGFSQLCIASGGVTRDFLSILSKCLGDIILTPDSKIQKEMVTAHAGVLVSSKMNALKNDNNENLENCLFYLKDFVIKAKRTNCFLVSLDESNKNSEGRKIIQDLFDLRLIHLINKKTSCAPSDGKSYEAYILDVGLYDFTRLTNFKQIEPDKKGEKSRKDDMRGSPKISLSELVEIKSGENSKIS